MKSYNNKINILLLVIFAMGIMSCTKENNDDDHDHGVKGEVILKMDHLWYGEAFSATDGIIRYLDNGQDLEFSVFKYYFTNIGLKRADGTWWNEENSYRIVDASSEDTNITINDVPEGEYTEIRYMIGVDSLKNFSGAQEGALSPSEEMFWSWNTGYIFIKAEGISTSIAGSDNEFRYHIGGFRGENSGIRTTEHPFGGELRVRRDASPSIHLHIHAQNFFEGKGMNINVAEMPKLHMVGENSKRIADNYADMIEFDHIHN